MTRTTNYFRATVLIPIRPWARRTRGEAERERELFGYIQAASFFSSLAREPRPPNTGAVVVAVCATSRPELCHRLVGKSVNSFAFFSPSLLKKEEKIWETARGALTQRDESKVEMTAFGRGRGPTLQCGRLVKHTACGRVGVDWEYN